MVLAIAAATGMLAMNPLHQQVEPWDSETIRLLPNRTVHLSGTIALDANGNPHITYVDDGVLVHAYKTGGLWTSEDVDSLHGSSRVNPSDPTWFFSVPSTSIVVSGDDVHIAYMGEQPPLRYARKTNGSWSTEVVDERASSCTLKLSLALDGARNPSISYGGYPSGADGSCSLKYASRSAGKWNVEVVGAENARRGKLSGQQSALSLDGGAPQIVTVTNRGLYYASKEVDWFAEVISENEGVDVTLACDSTGRPRVAWLEKDTLRVAQRIGPGNWVVAAYGDSIDPDFNTFAMDVDATGTVHIVLGLKGALKYLVLRDTRRWEVKIIDRHAFVVTPIHRISLVLDDLDRPHICYVRRNDPSHKAMTYAIRP